MSENRKFTTKQLVIIAMLVALNVILSRFLSIAAWNIKIGFAFVPVVFAALYLGPWQAPERPGHWAYFPPERR